MQDILFPPESSEAAFESLPRRVQGGVCTTQITLSAHIGDNSEIFTKILDLHVPKGATVADVTYGKGVFWKKVNPHDYRVVRSDIQDGGWRGWRIRPDGFCRDVCALGTI